MAIVNIDTTVYKLVQTPAENVYTLTGLPTNTIAAANVSIDDAGNYYVSDNVEGALQEVGADLVAFGLRITEAETEIDTLQGDVSGLDGRVTTAEGNITALGTEIMGTQDSIQNLNYYSNSLNFYSPIQTLTISAGLIAWDMANGQRAKVTLTQSATLSNPTNSNPSIVENLASFPDLEVKQDAVGGRVLSFGTSFVFSTSYTAAPTTANSYTLYHFQFRSDGKIAVNYTHFAA